MEDIRSLGDLLADPEVLFEALVGAYAVEGEVL